MQESTAVLRRIPYPVQVALLAALYFLAAKLSLLLAVPPGYASAAWPPAGIALAAMLLFGSRLWPGIWLGAALGNFGVESSALVAAMVGCGNTLEAMVGAALVRRAMRDFRRFERTSEVLAFVAIAALGASIAASIGVAALSLLHQLSWPEILHNWLTWWQGDATGIIVLTPLILTWSAPADTSGGTAWSARKSVEAVLFLAMLGLACMLAFDSHTADGDSYPLMFILPPLIMSAAFRFGQREVTVGIAMTCGIAVWHAVAQRGIFNPIPTDAVLLVLLVFVCIVMASGLSVSAVLRERNRAAEQLQRSHDELGFQVRQRTIELEHANEALRKDISAREQADKRLQQSEHRTRQILDTAYDAFVGIDSSGAVTLWNAEATRLFGWSAGEVIGQSLADKIIPEQHREAHTAGLQRFLVTGHGPVLNKRIEIDALHRDGHEIPVELTIWPVPTDDGHHFNAFIHDISDRKRIEERLTRLAQFDSLTNLPNRHLLHDRLALTLAQAARSHARVGCVFIDLDHFKGVNDTLGHSIGDKLLIQAAQRLEQCVRSGDTVGRLGGDEFAVVLSNLHRASDTRLVGEKIVAALAVPFDLDGRETYVSASLGIAIYPDDGKDADTLLKNADSAMYRAKEQGGNNYQFYLPEMHERAMQRLQLETRLHGALERGEFFLQYQPKVDLSDGAISGFEALLRWKHPELGLTPPDQFMGSLEDTGLIVPVGEWVLHMVCEQIRSWQSQGLKVRPVAINLSGRQFQQRYLDVFIEHIKNTGIDPALLELELTESLLMSEVEEVARTLTSLKNLGLRLSVDDFGTGYSSLAYLKRFPLDSLKIDRVFINDLSSNSNDADITRAIISMAHSLKLTVVAEGVETAEQLAFLRRLGCNEIQGYYFSRPMDVADCTRALLEDWRLQPSGAGSPDAVPPF